MKEKNNNGLINGNSKNVLKKGTKVALYWLEAIVVLSFICFMLFVMHRLTGKHIKEDVLYKKRVEYVKEIVKNLAVHLTDCYRCVWGYKKFVCKNYDLLLLKGMR